MSYGYACFAHALIGHHVRGSAAVGEARYAFTSPSPPLHLPFFSCFTSPSSPLHLPSPPLPSLSPIPPVGRRPLSAGCPSRKRDRAPKIIGSQATSFSEPEAEIFTIPLWSVPERCL